jgi:hypothetical protein
MKRMKTAAMAMMGGILMAGPAFAQQAQTGQAAQANGTTSGPAAGNNVQPSGATQNKSGSAAAGSTSAGAPGAPAKKGTESGQPPKR